MSAMIQHDPERRCFHCDVEGERCVLDYLLADGIMTITHTGVPDAVGGRGTAGKLVAAAFETARASGWKVRPACSYAAAWVRRHPEFAGIVT